MPEIYTFPRGTDYDIPVTVIDPETGDEFLLDDTYTLTGKVWIGDDQAALFTPAVLLDRPPGNTSPTANVVLRILKASTTGLTPGDYKAQGYADDGTSYKPLFTADGIILRLTSNPGTATARTSWVSWDEVQRYSEAMSISIATRADQYGFLEQRADATQELKDEVIERAMLRPGYTRRRGTTYHEVHGFDIPVLEAPPSKEEIRAAMDLNRLMVTDKVKEMLAMLTIRRVLGDNLTDSPRDNPFLAQSVQCQARFKELFHDWEAFLDMDGDSTYDVAIKIDATYLGDPP